MHLGKHFSPVPYKHVCILSVLPRSCLYGDLSSCFVWYLCPALSSQLVSRSGCVGFSQLLNLVLSPRVVVLKVLWLGCKLLWQTRLYAAAYSHEAKRTDLPKADLGTGLGLLKQQLEAWSRSDADAVVCCRPDTDHLLTKEQTRGRFQSSGQDLMNPLSFPLSSGFCFIWFSFSCVVYFIRRSRASFAIQCTLCFWKIPRRGYLTLISSQIRFFSPSLVHEGKKTVKKNTLLSISIKIIEGELFIQMY